jgi:nucleoside-diphosphate-sugar epimerase
MNIAIIGAAGFLGETLSKYLVAAGHRVSGFDIIKPSLSLPGYFYHKIDILKDEINIFSDTDAVFYLAQSPFYRDFPFNSDHLFAVSLMGAVKAARAASGQKVRMFCFASSGNVYSPSFEPLSEIHAVRRDNAYALSKLFSEEALDLFQGEMRIVSARFFGIFGPGQKTMLPIQLLNAIKDRESIYLQPSPEDKNDQEGLRISFSYNLDVAQCLLRLAELGLDGAALPSILNVAGPEAISIRTFADTIGSIIGIEPHFAINKQPRQFDLIANIERLRSLIEVNFTPFQDAMVATYKQ